MAMTAGAGFVLYLATAPDSASAPAEADAIATRPLLRPEPAMLSQSGVIRIASTSFAMAVDATTPGHDRRDRVRGLQKALAQADCYAGPINGVWTDASKNAMHNFLQTANAKLPVDSPDEALVAIMESNQGAACALGRAIVPVSLKSTAQATASEQTLAQPIPPSALVPSAKDHTIEASAPLTLLGRAWAPAGMLAAAENAEPADAPEAPAIPSKPSLVAEVTAVSDIPPMRGNPQPQPSSTIHFEGGGPLPDVQAVDDPKLVAPHDEIEPGKAELQKTKKSKTAKRRSGKPEDVQTTISKGFDTIQRSIASIF
jgi:hypothetical protein